MRESCTTDRLIEEKGVRMKEIRKMDEDKGQ